MSDMQTLKDDLAFLRTMAESGRESAPQGGAILATAGFTFGVAALVHWAADADLIPLSLQQIWIFWALAAAIFYAVLFVTLRAIKRQGEGGAAARLAGAAWAALGGAAFTLLAACIAASWTTRSPLVWAVTPSVFLALYGSGWIIASVASGKRWMAGVGYASFSAAVFAAFLVTSPLLWLAYGASLIALMGVPGLLLARRDRAAA